MTTVAETPAQQYTRLSHEFEALRRIHPDDRTLPQKERLRAVHQELRAFLAVPPAGYEMPKLAADLIAHANANGWKSGVAWTQPDFSGEPFVKVEVGRKLDPLERDQHRGDHWLYQLTWHSRDCAPGKVKLFRAGLAQTPDSPQWSDAPSVKAICAVISANPGVRPATEVAPPLVGADLWQTVMDLAEGRCQCQGACGKRHLDAERNAGRCEHTNGGYIRPYGHVKLLAIPRDPTLPWHEAAALPAARLIAFCLPCSKGVTTVINRGVKKLPPQEDALFGAEPFVAARGVSNPT